MNKSLRLHIYNRIKQRTYLHFIFTQRKLKDQVVLTSSADMFVCSPTHICFTDYSPQLSRGHSQYQFAWRLYTRFLLCPHRTGGLN